MDELEFATLKAGIENSKKTFYGIASTTQNIFLSQEKTLQHLNLIHYYEALLSCWHNHLSFI